MTERDEAVTRAEVLNDNMREIELALGFDEPNGMTLAQARGLIAERYREELADD